MPAAVGDSGSTRAGRPGSTPTGAEKCDVLVGTVKSGLTPKHHRKTAGQPDRSPGTWGKRRRMGMSKRGVRAVLLVAAAAYQLREKHQEAELAVQNINDQLDALDPATRAAVITRLTAEEVKKVRDHRP